MGHHLKSCPPGDQQGDLVPILGSLCLGLHCTRENASQKQEKAPHGDLAVVGTRQSWGTMTVDFMCWGDRTSSVR